MRLVGIAIVSLVASCNVARPTFKCANWEDCGPGGACEPGTDSCSFADESCTKTGRRFSSIAPGPFRDACMEYLPDAPAGGLCDPNPGGPPCAGSRVCLSNRCVSTTEVDIGKKFACAKCAGAPNSFGYLVCWGELAILGPTAPAVLAPAGYACPADAQNFCLPECMNCPGNEGNVAVCPLSCGGTYTTLTYSVGENHLCWYNGRLYCIGTNDRLQLGEGQPDFTANPGAVAVVRLTPTLDRPISGSRHNCARGLQSDRVFCWGDNEFGQLTADGSFTQLASATAQSIVAGAPVFPPKNGVMTGVEFLAASQKFNCAASNEDVRCWGTVPWSTGAGTIAGLPPGQITDLDVGLNHACVVKGGKVVCWGSNRQGQVDPTTPSMEAPVTIVLDNAQRVVAGRVHTCAITKAGIVTCWGASDANQLDGQPGPGPVEVRSLPTAVGPITAGDDVTCAIFADDRIRCWGDVLETNGVAYTDFEICTR